MQNNVSFKYRIYIENNLLKPIIEYPGRFYIIQLLTIEALDMMWYRPENTNIDRGEGFDN